ncbi:hypothetical protein NESM_000222800 [Novymonas esmeraldas]|uniref:Uncharacterized protein n=1 Tax=Novymonas esmeraldas TaxID=1808958 RepID=A0AAW0F9Q8_9TRYP
MYSESDVEDFEREVFNESSEESAASDGADVQFENNDTLLTTAHVAYSYMFDAEDSLFRMNFPSYYIPPNAAKEMSKTVLAPALVGDEIAEVLAAEAEAEVAEHQGRGLGSERSQALASGAALPNSGAGAAWVCDGKPSPASRFLCEHRTACIMIPVDKALNRASLSAAHRDAFAGLAAVGENGLTIVPGYNHSDAVGWALPLTTDAAVLAVVKALYPGWRRATQADVRFFCRSSSSATAAKTAVDRPPQLPSRHAWTRSASKLMRSKERLLARIRAGGGWAAVTFVAVDVEAFAVLPQSVPVPAEYAFLPVRGPWAAPVDPAAHAPLHFFCHPGPLAPEHEVTMLHTCLCTHLIPHRNASFLSVDFANKAREVDQRFVRKPQVILINKGDAESPTLMDMQAMRWLYAAAVCQEGRSGIAVAGSEAGVDEAHRIGRWVPSAEDIYCFDVSVLEAAAAECADVALISKKEAPVARVRSESATGYCWYHTIMDEHDLVEGGVHCAMRDAQALAHRVEAALYEWRPTTLA